MPEKKILTEKLTDENQKSLNLEAKNSLNLSLLLESRFFYYYQNECSSVRTISNENDLIFKRMDAQVTCIFIGIVCTKTRLATEAKVNCSSISWLSEPLISIIIRKLSTICNHGVFTYRLLRIDEPRYFGVANSKMELNILTKCTLRQMSLYAFNSKEQNSNSWEILKYLENDLL